MVQFLPVRFNLCLLGLFCLCVVHCLCGLIFLREVHIVSVRFSFSLYGANSFTTHHLVFFCSLPGFESTTSYITVQHVTTRLSNCWRGLHGLVCWQLRLRHCLELLLNMWIYCFLHTHKHCVSVCSAYF